MRSQDRGPRPGRRFHRRLDNPFRIKGRRPLGKLVEGPDDPSDQRQSDHQRKRQRQAEPCEQARGRLPRGCTDARLRNQKNDVNDLRLAHRRVVHFDPALHWSQPRIEPIEFRKREPVPPHHAPVGATNLTGPDIARRYDRVVLPRAAVDRCEPEHRARVTPIGIATRSRGSVARATGRARFTRTESDDQDTEKPRRESCRPSVMAPDPGRTGTPLMGSGDRSFQISRPRMTGGAPDETGRGGKHA